MDSKNELNDIILNKGNGTSGSKKIILAVATLGIILVVVVMLMSSLSPNGTKNLPQAALPPKPELQKQLIPADEPLFEEVQVIEETNNDNDNLEQIAKKLKEESKNEKVAIVKPIAPKTVVKKTVAAVKKKAVTSVVVATGSYYIQVGSFSKYEPNKKFLKSITDLNFKYKYHKVIVNSQTINKVLIGPFHTKKEAQNAKRKIRAKIEPGAFLFKL